MTTRIKLLALFTLLCIVTSAAIPFIPEYVEPFDGTQGPVPASLKVLPSSLGLSMPEGLEAGDVFYYAELTPRSRTFFMTGSLNVPTGTSMDLVVHRADGIHQVSVSFQRVDFLNGSTGNRITEIASYLLFVLVTALGLLLLWRGRNMATLGVALWCFTLLIENIVSLAPLTPPYGMLLSRFGTTVSAVLTLIGLYLVAMNLAGSALRPEKRRYITWLFIAVLIAYCAGLIFSDCRLYFAAILDGTLVIVVRGIHFIGFGIPLALLVGAYSRATPLNQARIRWVLFSLLGLVAGYILNIGLITGDPVLLNIAVVVLSAASFIGFAYAVLKHQLVSLQVVLNRALVYGLMTSLVVGVFASALSFVEHTALNSETNRVVVMVVILLLGMGLDTIKRQVNTYLGKVFFRKRHEAEAALAQFARTCGHIDDAEKLLDLTADELFRRAGPQALGIYLTAPQSPGAALARQRGGAPSPPKLDSNDLGLLRLKTGDAEVNLLNVGSKLGQEGLVYALQVRSQLLGCIYLGPRPAEAYSAEERQLFERVAHQVAVALHALRLDAQRKLLEEIADGAFGTPPAVQTKVRELISVGN